MLKIKMYQQEALQKKDRQTRLDYQPLIQPKQKTCQPDDKYEKEADAMADEVMLMPSQKSFEMHPLITPPPVQMKCAQCEEEEEKLQMKMNKEPILQLHSENSSTTDKQFAPSSISQKLNGSKGSGSLLPDGVGDELGNKIGADFSNVKIHTNSEATQMNQDLGAKAFTHGNSIYFNKGEYNPSSSAGEQLLAHELTQVVQQTISTNTQPVIQADFWDTVSRGWELYWNLDDEGATFARQLMEHYAIGLGTDFDVHPHESAWNTFMLGRPEIQRAMQPVLERIAVSVAGSGPTEQPWIRFGGGPSRDETITGVRLNELESMRLTLHGCHRIEIHILYDVNAIKGGHEVIFRQIRMKWVDVGDMHPGTETELESGEVVDDSELTSAGSSYNIFIEFMPFERTIYHVVGGSATQISGWPPVPGAASPGDRS